MVSKRHSIRKIPTSRTKNIQKKLKKLKNDLYLVPVLECTFLTEEFNDLLFTAICFCSDQT